MIATFILVLSALIWMMVETKWLTVHLVMPSLPTVSLSGILEMGIGMVFLAVGFIMFPIENSIYEIYYKRWHDPIFHWLIKRVNKNQEVPGALYEMADKQILLYRQMEAEIESEI